MFGKRLNKRAGVLVAAVLAPHHRKERELQVVRHPTQKLNDVIVFVTREA